MSLSNEQLLTELTLKETATITGGVSNTRNTDNSQVKSRIGKGRARIRVGLRGRVPNKNISNEYGECRPSFGDSTGKFTFSCVLRDSSVFGDKLFPDL